MGIAVQREIREILQRLERARPRQFARAFISAKHLRNFEIDQVGRVKGLVFGEQPGCDPEARRRIQQNFDQDRCVDDDHRCSRSARTARAGGTFGLTADRVASLSFNSKGVGRSAICAISWSR